MATYPPSCQKPQTNQYFREDVNSMIPFLFMKKDAKERKEIVNDYYARLVRGRKKIGELDDWCLLNLGIIGINNFKDVVTAELEVLNNIKVYMDKNTINLPNSLKTYIINTLYEKGIDKVQFAQMIEVTVCPYCNRNFINASSLDFKDYYIRTILKETGIMKGGNYLRVGVSGAPNVGSHPGGEVFEEQLINGKSVKKRIHQELTYRDLDSKLDHLWSILFTTGYLTQCGTQTGDVTELVIPNKEIQWIFVEQIRDWFDDETIKNRERLENFCRAFEENNVLAIENVFQEYLEDMISIRDTSVRKGMKENFYHGLLLGILGNMDNWIVQSNAESGDGYSDISIEIRRKGIGIVIELKYAENAALEEACKEAVEQINKRNYEESLKNDGMTTIYKYGIACYKKRCKVISG